MDTQVSESEVNKYLIIHEVNYKINDLKAGFITTIINRDDQSTTFILH